MEDLASKIADFVKGIGDFTIEQTKTGAILITPIEKDNGKQRRNRQSYSTELE